MINTEFLTEIARIFQSGMGADETYAAVFRILEKTMPFDSATLFLYRPQKDCLEKVYQRGDTTVDLIQEIPFARGRGISSWMSTRSEPIVLPSLVKSRPGREARFNSFLSFPLRAKEKLIGVLNLGHQEADRYTHKEARAYQLIASQISAVFDRLLLEQELDRKNKKLTQAITELKATQDELMQKERLAAIGEVVVTVNHEINNPLTSIMGLAEILDLTCSTTGTDRLREGLRGILKEARRIQRVTQQLTELECLETETYIGDQRMVKLRKRPVSAADR